MMKAIIFAKAPEVGDKEKLLEVQLNKLRQYAQKNNFEIIDEFQVFENSNLGENKTFLEILNKIENQDSKIHVICYSEFNSKKTDIDDKFRSLLKQQKIELEVYCHPCFKEPGNNNVKIWRYLTLPKFIDLLQSSMLFFTRADYLRTGDNSEAAYLTNVSLNVIDKVNELSNKNIIVSHPHIPNLTINDIAKQDLQMNIHNEQVAMKEHFINCWHINDFESFAMWKIYSESFGVCIQSTFHDLYSCFDDEEWSFYNKRKKIYIGEVNYIDWEKEIIPKDNMFWPYIHKKKEFTYEQELRCIVSCRDLTYLKIRINTEKLIHKIYINPFTPPWFEKVVINLCQQYNVPSHKIIQSSLA